VDATRDLLANLLASAISVEYGEGVCAGGRDRYRTCDLCRVNSATACLATIRGHEGEWRIMGNMEVDAAVKAGSDS